MSKLQLNDDTFIENSNEILNETKQFFEQL